MPHNKEQHKSTDNSITFVSQGKNSNAEYLHKVHAKGAKDKTSFLDINMGSKPGIKAIREIESQVPEADWRLLGRLCDQEELVEEDEADQHAHRQPRHEERVRVQLEDALDDFLVLLIESLGVFQQSGVKLVLSSGDRTLKLLLQRSLVGAFDVVERIVFSQLASR